MYNSPPHFQPQYCPAPHWPLALAIRRTHLPLFNRISPSTSAASVRSPERRSAFSRGSRLVMHRESLIPFLPAALAAVTDVLTACVVTAHQPDYPARAVVYQVVMFGTAISDHCCPKQDRVVMSAVEA